MRVSLKTLMLPVRGIAFYESDWMALHRLLWTNALNGPDLWRLAGGGKADQATRFARFLIGPHLPGAIAAHFRERSPLACFGRENYEAMRELDVIRFCPVCLREGFHSPVFQLASVARCPLHGCALRSTCERCDHAIGHPTLLPPHFEQPLACRHCHQHFVAAPVAKKILAGSATGIAKFSEVELWLLELRSVRFKGTLQSPGAPRTFADHQAICDGLVRIAFDGLDAEPWLQLALPPLSDRLRWTSLVQQKRFFCDLQQRLPLEPDVATACAVAKSVNRFLTWQTRLICGHNTTSHLRIEADRGGQWFCEPEEALRLTPSDCPCCAVLNQWRAYVGKVFLLRDQIRETGHPLLDGGASGFRMRLSLEPRVFAVALTSSFAWFAVTLRRALDVLGPQEPQSWLGGEKQIFRSEDQALLLCVPATDITPYVYLFSTDRGPVWLAYPLSHGFAAQRGCMAVRCSGNLCASSQESPLNDKAIVTGAAAQNAFTF